ncbi:pilus assembly protein Flp/PilA [Tindallia magadiensis]|uniref:Pilus assembly protein Flp/PilA n=1 Tax=Tindallia magadiensis TaxID=69895 RepID=A0A1I3EJH2_9FIRM|nr:Flp family type IVb pilin [Tindallia magadiensis]SFH99083.1 pilus assembly protein Flp/PilA [Tindallia magadiensis]SFH99112.1 pilus assembly protein Flp/PilA [Tindallia magadiensis]
MNWLLKEESGQGMVEYGLILVLVSVVAITMLTNIGTQLESQFKDIWKTLGGESTP